MCGPPGNGSTGDDGTDAPGRGRTQPDGSGGAGTETGVDVPETGVESKVLEYFVLDPMGPTDDYHLAKRAEEAGLTWYVHGGVTALQINPDGQVFHFKDARQKIAEEVSALAMSRSGFSGLLI